MGVSIIGVRRHMHQMYQGLMSITMSVYTYTILNRMWEKLQLSLLCISGPDPPSQSGQASLGCDNFCNSNKKKNCRLESTWWAGSTTDLGLHPRWDALV